MTASDHKPVAAAPIAASPPKPALWSDEGFGYRAYVSAMIAMIYLFASTDRNIMSILLVPIQKEYGANDTTMGWITGAAFTFVYAVAGFPLARLADRGNRRNLIAASVVVWSAFTAACGIATTLITLLLARIGVAAGEAGSQPGAMSMIGDLFPRHRRGIAMSFTQVGSALGSGVGAFVAGATADRYGWRAAFLVMGIPGVLFGVLLFLTMREPKRGVYETLSTRPPATSWESIRYIFSVPTVVRLVAAKIVLNLAVGGILAWMPAFFMRVHHLSATEMSAGFGLSLAAGSITATLTAGLATDHLSKRGERWRIYYCCASLLCGIPFGLLTILAPTPQLSFFGFFMSMVCCGGIQAAVSVAGLAVVRSDVRGLMTVVTGFCVMVVGAGLGPVLFGALSDLFKEAYGHEAIRYSLLAVPVFWFAASCLFFFAAQTTDRDAAASLEAH